MAKKRTIAALDVGSHEITLKIAQLERTGLPLELETVRQTLAIGTDTYRTGEISDETVRELVAVIERMAGKIREYKVTQVFAVATSAIREARNRQVVLDQIDRIFRHPIQVLSNAQERYFHSLATIAHWPPFTDQIKEGTLVLDLGSGSIQVTVFDKGAFLFSQNMRLGALRIRELLSDLERRTADFGRLMEDYISTDLENYRALEPKGTTYKNLVVLGADTSFMKLLAGLAPDQPASLSANQIEAIYRKLLITTPAELSMNYDIPGENASLLLPAAILIQKFIDFTGVKTISMPVASLSDGLLVEMVRLHGHIELSHDPDDDILHAARQMVRRYQSNKRHVQQVEQAAARIFDATRRLHRLGARQRLLLQLASLLHDTGKFINMNHHKIRSYHIILSTEIIGLSDEEQRQVAWVARFYSGTVGYHEPGFEELVPKAQLEVLKLAAILRLADSLDASHRQAVTIEDISMDDDNLFLHISSPEDLTLVQWSFEHKSPLFRTVFGVTPRIKVRRK
ncbi:MAG: HD domain-containing protein [Clostridia bacterium]|nr:HD domain-containing protein [Clostridia bacterium]NCC74833.1 HD domain-containing protein [Clostridia bacterium]